MSQAIGTGTSYNNFTRYLACYRVAYAYPSTNLKELTGSARSGCVCVCVIILFLFESLLARRRLH